MSFDAEFRGESKSGVKSKFYARHRKVNPLYRGTSRIAELHLPNRNLHLFVFRKLCSSGTEKNPRFYCIFETNAESVFDCSYVYISLAYRKLYHNLSHFEGKSVRTHLFYQRALYFASDSRDYCSLFLSLTQ